MGWSCLYTFSYLLYVLVRDRNDAFDFNVSLVDFEDKRKIEKNPYASKEEFELKDDLSLKQG